MRHHASQTQIAEIAQLTQSEFQMESEFHPVNPNMANLLCSIPLEKKGSQSKKN